MKIIRSVRDANGNVIQKQPEGGVGRLRCPKCQGLCVQQARPDGTPVMACGSCGAAFTRTSMDPTVKQQPGAVPTRPTR